MCIDYFAMGEKKKERQKFLMGNFSEFYFAIQSIKEFSFVPLDLVNRNFNFSLGFVICRFRGIDVYFSVCLAWGFLFFPLFCIVLVMNSLLYTSGTIY